MWSFIKYCFFCLGTVVSAAFGNNPECLTWKNGIVGILTLIALACLIFGMMWIISFVGVHINKAK